MNKNSSRPDHYSGPVGYKWTAFGCPSKLKDSFLEACEAKRIKPVRVLQLYIERFSLKEEFDCLAVVQGAAKSGLQARVRVPILIPVRKVFLSKCTAFGVVPSDLVCAFMEHYIGRHIAAVDRSYRSKFWDV